MSEQISVSFKCEKCGPVSVNFDEKLGDAAPVRCATCGLDFGITRGEIQKRAQQTAADSLIDPLKKNRKKSGWKITER